jgi:hypothetical protein
MHFCVDFHTKPTKIPKLTKIADFLFYITIYVFLLTQNSNKRGVNKTKQNKTKHNKTKQNKTTQNKTKQNKTKHIIKVDSFTI